MKRYGLGAVYLRGHIYWLRYSCRGREQRESSGTDNEARALKLLKQRIAETARGKLVAKEERVTFADLKAALLSDYEIHRRRSRRSLESLLRAHIEPAFGTDRAIDIDGARIRGYTAMRLQEGAKPGSINRELCALQRAFALVLEDGRLSSAPKFHKLREDNVRTNFLEYADFERLHAQLPVYLKDLIAFLWWTDWRRGEVSSLEWRDIDQAANEVRLRPERSKNGQARILPLSNELLAIIERARARRTLAVPFIFHDQGRQLRHFDRAWKSACEAAGLGGLLVHDLRRSAIRNLIRCGVSESVAMKISGHKTASVFRRYDVTSRTDLARAMERVQTQVTGSPSEAKVATIGGKVA